MRRVHQFVSCYLALCFACAGAVGISPFLHRLVEHGGNAPANTHIGFTPRAMTAHVHEDEQGVIHLPGDPPEPRPKDLFEHDYAPFTLPKFPCGRYCTA